MQDKLNKIDVDVIRNYKFPDFNLQSPQLDNKWGNIQFNEIIDYKTNSNYLICLNPPLELISTNIPIENRWLIIQEPPIPSTMWMKNSFKYFGHIISQFDYKDNLKKHSSLPWHLSNSYDELVNQDIPNKSKILSTITSSKSETSGQRKRTEFLNFLKQQKLHFDWFGKGFKYLNNKQDGLLPYKYSICIENTSTENYWTEKLSDSFLTYTMPIYFGCKNLTDYFPSESYIQIDLKYFKRSLEIIKLKIANNTWENNIESICQARDSILNNHQFFPFASQLINNNFNDIPLLKDIEFIPGNPPPKSFLNNLRSLF